MWGNIFRSVLPMVNYEQIYDFKIGDPSIRIKSSRIFEKNIKQAMQLFKRDNKIPILIFPITSVYEYTSINEYEDPDLSKVQIINPAFKTRDDIFLFLYKYKELTEGEGKIYPKGEDLTTTKIGKLYNKIILDNGADPLWHNKQGQNWGYSLKFEKCKNYNNRLECYNNPDYYGFIAAGEELKRFWFKKDWISSINLNSWICHFFKINYFPRTFFVSLIDCFKKEDILGKIDFFWDEYVKFSRKWLNKKCDHKGVHGLYYSDELVLPIQIPAVSSKPEDYYNELSEDLSAIKTFLSLTKDGDNHRHFDFSDIYFMDKFLAYELFRKNERKNLTNEVLKIINLPEYTTENDRTLYQDAVDNFIDIPISPPKGDEPIEKILNDCLNNCLTNAKKRCKGKKVTKQFFELVNKILTKYRE